MNEWLDPADILKAFDPDEARNSQGEWTGGTQDTKPTRYLSPTRNFLEGRVRDKQAEVRARQARVADLERRLSALPHDTDGVHYWGVHGQLAMERAQLHEASRDLERVTGERDYHNPLLTGVHLLLGKAFNPDEARDAVGRWTSEGGGPPYADKVTPEDGYKIGDHFTEDPGYGALTKSLEKVYDAGDKLRDHADAARDHEGEEPNYERDYSYKDDEGKEQHDDEGYDEDYKNWEDQHHENMQSVSDHVMGVRRALADHVKFASDELAKLDARITHEAKDGVRVGKAFDPSEPRDSHGMWTTGADAPHPDYMSSSEGEALYGHLDDAENRLSDHLSTHVNLANDKLLDAYYAHEDVENDEPDREEVGDKAFEAWSAKNDASGHKVVDAALGVRQALIDHANKTADEIAKLDEILQEHEDGYGRREDVHKADEPLAFNEQEDSIDVEPDNEGNPASPKASKPVAKPGQGDDDVEKIIRALEKAFDPDEPRDPHGEWTTGGAAHAAALLHAGTNPDKFYEAFNALQADKAISKTDLDRVANHYMNAPSGATLVRRFSNKAEAHRAIESTFVRRARFEQKIAPSMDVDAVRQQLEESGFYERARARREGLDKNLTAGDVHATTALGNEDPKKRKAKDFLTTIGEVKGGGRIVGVPAMPDVGKRGRMYSFMLMRHGPTKMNNQTDMSQDRVRSWNDAKLTPDGREAAAKAGEKLKKELDGQQAVLITSDLGRAVDTGKIVGDIIGVKPINTPLLRPWNLGDFTGKTTAETYDDILSYVEDTPDEPVPGGESFDDFSKRFVEGLQWAIQKAGDKVLVLVSHHRNERWLASWIDAGMPADHHVDAKEFMKTGEDPGDVTVFEIDLGALAGKKVTKNDVTNGNGGGVNASLKLIDLGDNNARSPFPYDQYAFAGLRNDQKERFLAALTDQDELPVRTVRLSGLSSIQDRVDPEKVQAMLGTPPDKLPVVIRLAPGRHVIADGHHRLTAQFLNGCKTAMVRYSDIEGVDNRIKTDGNTGSEREEKRFRPRKRRR